MTQGPLLPQRQGWLLPLILVGVATLAGVVWLVIRLANSE